MDVDKALTRATLGAAVIGLLIVVYALATDSIPATSKGYSELYFEKPAEAPEAMEVGKKYVIPFVVSSNEKKTTSYNYTATFNGAEIVRGEFTLLPEEKKTLTVELIPDASSASSWKLSSNRSQRVVDRFTIDVAFIKENKNGGITLHPVKVNQSNLNERGLRMLPLNQLGLYSGETQYVKSFNTIQRGRMTSSMNIGNSEIYMAHSSQMGGYNFTWSNRVQLPGLEVDSLPIVWLAVPKGDYLGGKLQSGSIVYKNTSIDFKAGLPGEIYLSPLVGVEREYIISYSTTNATASRIEHVEKNATITVDKDAISIENIIKEKTYALEKAKLSILLNSDAGKSYEIHFWSYVEG